MGFYFCLFVCLVLFVHTKKEVRKYFQIRAAHKQLAPAHLLETGYAAMLSMGRKHAETDKANKQTNRRKDHYGSANCRAALLPTLFPPIL